MVGRCCRVLLALMSFWAIDIRAWQNLDTDELRTRSGPYTPGGFGATFTASAKLVEIPAIVRDSYNHAVEGLHQQDFALYDLGKKREITTFSVQNNLRPGRVLSNSPAESGAQAVS